MSEIPEAAIVAGARALGHLEGEDEWPPVDDTWGQYEENLLAQAKSVLEAALPHLQPEPQTITSMEEAHALPANTVVLDKRGRPYAVGADPINPAPEPEPERPWENARDGEVWVLDFRDPVFGTQGSPALTIKVSGEPTRFDFGGLAIDVNDPAITSARRIWPEPEDDDCDCHDYQEADDE